MRSLFKLALSACLLWTIGSNVPARAERPAIDDRATALLSLEQGQALVDLALRHQREFHPKPDCSHLVHRIYSLGGLNYDYAGSRDIYYGTEGFERVFTPQPGDLIVWLGHVGIVVEPEDQTFFSSVRSGIITESWTTDYWHSRGRPRFYRYRISPATDQLLLAALTPKQPEPIEPDDVSVARAALPAGTARPNLRLEERPVTVAGAKAAKVPLNAAAQPGLAPARLPAMAPARLSVAGPLAAAPQEQPAVVALIRQRAKPSKQDVFVALTQSGTVRAQKLIAGQQLNMARPVSVIGRVEVQKIKLKNDVGTIQLKLAEAISLEGGKVLTDKSTTRQLCLYRRGEVWVICDPEERFYIPQEQALSAFERQAELFLRQTPSGTATRSVVKALDILFDRETASKQRAALK